MRELSRMQLYEQLTESIFEGKRISSLARANMAMLHDIEDAFVSDMLVDSRGQAHIEQPDNTSNLEDISIDYLLSRNKQGYEEYLRSLGENANEDNRAPFFGNIKSIELETTEYFSESNSSDMKRRQFLSLIDKLTIINNRWIEENKQQLLDNLPKNYNLEMPQAFLSYPFKDHLYTISLFNYFYDKGVYLYIDWMQNPKEEDGAELKRKLRRAMWKSSQLLLWRAPRQELLKENEPLIRPWCAWELGEFYGKDGGFSQFFSDVYASYVPDHLLLHGMKLFQKIEQQRLVGKTINKKRGK